jgi:uncharacterized protein
MDIMEFPSTLWLFLTLSAPALLLGFSIAGIVRTFLNPDKVGKWLGRGKASDVILASAVGVPIPLCSCSVIPTAIAIKQKGASRAAVSAFLISTPESGIDSILVTRAMMDWPMTIIRPVAAFASAFLAGFLQLILNPEEKKFTPVEAPTSCCAKKAAQTAHDHKHDHDHNHDDRINSQEGFFSKIRSGLKWSINDLVDDLALWMTIGLFAGAVLQFIIPEDFFLGFGVWPSRLLCLVIGIPIYICASATTPIAASLVMKGLSPGAALILLLVGPATNVANLAVLRPHLGNKGIVINVFSISLIALIGAIGIDLFYANVTPVWNITQHLHDHHSVMWWEHVCAGLLVIILSRGIWREEIKPRLKIKKKDCCHT